MCERENMHMYTYKHTHLNIYIRTWRSGGQVTVDHAMQILIRHESDAELGGGTYLRGEERVMGK